MTPQKNTFDTEAFLHDLKHYLPAQAPLKDFIHHNTLHAFSLSFIIDGLAIIRIYARIFLGPHVKSIYETAYRSS